MIYFTADTHFGHRNILKYCRRPFADLSDMHAELRRRWNVVVGPNEDVYHLGDVSWHTDPAPFLEGLNGRIHVLLGNHDEERHLRRCLEEGLIESLQHVRYVRWEKRKFFLSHYAHRVWPNSHRGTFHLFGHSHGDLPDHGRSMDVGVDAPGMAYAPISAQEVIDILEKEDPVFHHNVIHINGIPVEAP